MQITSLVQWFEFGCAELGIRIHLHPKIDIVGFDSPEPIVLLPDFGGINGTLIYEGSFAKTKPPLAVLKAHYTVSTMGSIRRGINFDVGSFKELLIDWGWSGEPAKKPTWITD